MRPSDQQVEVDADRSESGVIAQWAEHSPVVIPISSIVVAASPRLAGHDEQHARILSELDVKLPPIIVHRDTLQVIDGTHRLRAAVLRGDSDIEARLFDGTDADAFVLAVEANIAHGLPLSLADRTAAAARIISSHPAWSDRAIASATGLSRKTVAAIRRRSTGDVPQSNTRIGRDGRVRPLSADEGRRIAGKLLADRPSMSVREAAKAAGISVSTAHDVRKRLRQGEGSLHSAAIETRKGRSSTVQDKPNRPTDGVRDASPQKRDSNATLQSLRRDPSLRLAVAGRRLLHLLSVRTLQPEEWTDLANNVPAHCTDMVADVARECAMAWREFAENLEHR